VVVADLVLVLHALVVAFNVGGLLMIVVGGPLGWAWVRFRGFRLAHIAMMGLVTVEAVLGMTCPLTLLEDTLRGVATEQSFVQRWVSALIYWNAPAWVFALLYVAFLMAVVAAWLIWPPATTKKQSARG
jgi:ABC-type branched-subunit amino acid transport system permease subunit